MALEDDEGSIKQVEIDALVVLQIMKHCRQHVPSAVTGQLLGLDIDYTVQVTHSFGQIQKQPEGDPRDERTQSQGQEDTEQYQIDMLRRLREVNVDSNTVGWYQTTHLGQFFSDQVIETQYLYQTQIPHSVLLVFDPLQANIGKAALKAYRLAPTFVYRFAEAKEHGPQYLADFPSAEMFEEIPVVVRSPLLVEAFLVDWAISDPFSTTTQLDTLDLENQAFLEKNVQLLIGSLQDLAEEHQKLQMFERNAARKGEGKGKTKGPVRQPRPLDTMILSQQIQNYCKQINNFSGDAFGKLYLVSNKPMGSQKK